MPTGWFIAAVLAAIALGTLLWISARWLARAWEVLEDDQLSEKLSRAGRRAPAFWLRVRGWFAGEPRRLTYRRDARGRFRRFRR